MDESALEGIEAFSHLEVLFLVHAVTPDKILTDALKRVMAEFLPHEATRQPQWATELMARYWHKGSPSGWRVAGRCGRPSQIEVPNVPLALADTV